MSAQTSTFDSSVLKIEWKLLKVNLDLKIQVNLEADTFCSTKTAHPPAKTVYMCTAKSYTVLTKYGLSDKCKILVFLERR